MRRSVAVLALAVVAIAAQALPGDIARVLAQLEPRDRAAILANERTWTAWPEPTRDAFRTRASHWANAPARERQRRRDVWAAWRQLSDDERLQLRAEAARVDALPADARATLQREFDALDVTTQRGWRLGPVLGADYARLQPLLAQVPADEAAPLLRVLRLMMHVERQQLGVLAQRTPPQERDALRRELLSTSAANRSAWLQSRLDR